MAHTICFDDHTWFIFNSDFSGDVTIVHDRQQIKLPAAALRFLIAEQCRGEAISKLETVADIAPSAIDKVKRMDAEELLHLIQNND